MHACHSRAIQEFFERDDDARHRFKAGVIRRALKHFGSSGVQNVDPIMTGFRHIYAEYAARHFEKT
jgi:hypothetical protein